MIEIIDVQLAISKETPIRPTYRSYLAIHCCGKCEYYVDINYKYCSECGQKIEWER